MISEMMVDQHEPKDAEHPIRRSCITVAGECGGGSERRRRLWVRHLGLSRKINGGANQSGAVRALCSICRSREKNYLNLAYLGRPPKQLSAEEEADLPKEVQVR
jgi:hypothetical protein